MNLHPLLRPLLAAGALAALSSCEGIPGQYGDYGGGYNDGPGYSSYQSRPGFAGGGGYYGGGYARPVYGSPYYGGSRYYNNRNDYDHDHGHDNYRSSGSSRSSSSSNKKSSGNDIRLVKVRDGTRGDIPEGYHSKEWYQQRGISLSKNTYETRDGDRRGYTGSSSSSKSKSGSGSSSKSKSDSSSKKKND
jgi:hypothetical protein